MQNKMKLYEVVGSAIVTSTLSSIVICAPVTFVDIVNSFVANPLPIPISFLRISIVPAFMRDSTQSPPLVYRLDNVSLSTLPLTPLLGACINIRSYVPPDVTIASA